MEMEKQPADEAAEAAADTAAANVNWLIDIDNTQEQAKIKFDNQASAQEDDD